MSEVLGMTRMSEIQADRDAAKARQIWDSIQERVEDWYLLQIPNLDTREWLGKFGVQKWLSQFGLEICPECIGIGLIFTGDKLYDPYQHKSSTVRVWIHPKDTSKYFLDMLQMTKGATPEHTLHQMGLMLHSFFVRLGSTDTKDVRVCGYTVTERKDDRALEICPRCGLCGTGYAVVQHKVRGVYRPEKRFIHSATRSCYIGPEHPKLPKESCPKCGELGRPFTSDGYQFWRHSKKTCRVGKL